MRLARNGIILYSEPISVLSDKDKPIWLKNLWVCPQNSIILYFQPISIICDKDKPI